MAKSKEVANQEPSAVSLPDWMKQYQGRGQEDIHRDDIAMPRLKLGQSMSPEVKDGKASEGDFIHNITHEVICKAGDSVRFIPVAYSKEYILWFDRKGPRGGGIAARARRVRVDGRVRYMWDKPNATIEDKIGGRVAVTFNTKRFIDEDGLGDWGSQIPGDPDSPPAATAHQNYVILLPDHENQLVALSLSRSSEKKAREFNTLLKMGTAPTFGRIYKVGSFIDQADDNKFANYQFTGYELVEDPKFFEALLEMHEALKDKGVNVDFSDETGEEKGVDGKF